MNPQLDLGDGRVKFFWVEMGLYSFPNFNYVPFKL